MNKYYFLFLFFAAFINASAQIEFGGSSTPKIQEKLSYDSLENINARNLELQVGQTLFLKGTESCRKYKCKFFKQKTFTPDESLIFAPVTDTSLDPRIKRTVTDFYKVADKYYFVRNIYKNEKTRYTYNEAKYCIELVETSTNFTMFWLIQESDLKPVLLTEFLNAGFYTKMQSIYTGETYITKWNTTFIDANGQERTLPENTKMKCDNVLCNKEKNYRLFLEFTHPKYGKLYIETHGPTVHDLVSQSRVNYYVKKYGSQWGPLVARNQLRVGMTKDMVLDSYGEPDKINRTTTASQITEQWVYSYQDKYVYIRGNKVTSIQD